MPRCPKPGPRFEALLVRTKICLLFMETSIGSTKAFLPWLSSPWLAVLPEAFQLFPPRGHGIGHRRSSSSMKASLCVTTLVSGRKIVPPGLAICCYLKEHHHHHQYVPLGVLRYAQPYSSKPCDWKQILHHGVPLNAMSVLGNFLIKGSA